MKTLIYAILFFLAGSIIAAPGTTGKLYGQITNQNDGSPAPGISITVKGTQLGAASDKEGNYFIINIPEGLYTIEAGGIGYKTANIENVKIAADKSSKLNFSLEESNVYELTEKTEQFYLQGLSEEQRKKLDQIKKEDKIKYQWTLLRTQLKDSGKESAGVEKLTDEILKLTQVIDEKSKAYKKESNDEKKKQLTQEILGLLEKRFALIEKKMEFQIQKLAGDVASLKEELTKFRSGREEIIQGQFDTFVK